MSHFLGDDDDDFVLAGRRGVQQLPVRGVLRARPEAADRPRADPVARHRHVDRRAAQGQGPRREGRAHLELAVGRRRASRATTTRSGRPRSTRACRSSIHINIISRKQRAAQRKAAAASGQPALRHDAARPTRAKAIGGMSHVFSMAAGDITAMLFTGVFERFPELQVCWIETGVGWIPHLLECDRRPLLAQPRRGATSRSSEPPSFYWYRNNAASFITDRSGIALRHQVGRRQHHVVERLPAPRQRLAVLAQGHRRDDGPTSRPTSAARSRAATPRASGTSTTDASVVTQQVRSRARWWDRRGCAPRPGSRRSRPRRA